MPDADALRIALEAASDAIDQEAAWQLRVHWTLTRAQTRAVAAHLERISMELYERSRALGLGPQGLSPREEYQCL